MSEKKFLKNLFNKSKGKILAFTLAEVLITLGIIGVVAAMTIPNLITTHQKKVTVTKLQKAIAEINQAYRLSYSDVGEPIDDVSMGAEKYFQQYLAPYLKVANYCKKPDDCGYTSQTPFKYLAGSVFNNWLVVRDARATFQTTDGFTYVLMLWGTSDYSKVPINNIYVDINSGKGPNVIGKDVFVLKRLPNGAGIQPDCINDSQNVIEQSCSKKGKGFCCAEKIKRAGWQIDKSYPW